VSAAGSVALAVGAGALIGATLAGIAVWRYRDAQCSARINAEHAASAQALAAQVQTARAHDQAWTAARDKMEIDHAQALADLAAQAAASRAAVAARGLHDPGRRAATCRVVPGTAGAAAGSAAAPSDSRLSDEASGFLQTEADRADQCAVLARTCHDYAVSVGALRGGS